MTNRASATPEQLSELAAILTRMRFECDSLFDLISTMYGREGARAIRAQELCNHLQRLQWALERGDADNDVRLVQKQEAGNSEFMPQL
jgi:hypothetical protein